MRRPHPIGSISGDGAAQQLDFCVRDRTSGYGFRYAALNPSRRGQRLGVREPRRDEREQHTPSNEHNDSLALGGAISTVLFYRASVSRNWQASLRERCVRYLYRPSLRFLERSDTYVPTHAVTGQTSIQLNGSVSVQQGLTRDRAPTDAHELDYHNQPGKAVGGRFPPAAPDDSVSIPTSPESLCARLTRRALR